MYIISTRADLTLVKWQSQRDPVHVQPPLVPVEYLLRACSQGGNSLRRGAVLGAEQK